MNGGLKSSAARVAIGLTEPRSSWTDDCAAVEGRRSDKQPFYSGFPSLFSNIRFLQHVGAGRAPEDWRRTVSAALQTGGDHLQSAGAHEPVRHLGSGPIVAELRAEVRRLSAGEGSSGAPPDNARGFLDIYPHKGQHTELKLEGIR